MNLTLFINKKFNLNHALSYWRPQLLKKFEKPFELRLVVPFLNFNIYQKIFLSKKSFQTFSYFLNGKSCMQHIISCKTARHTKMTPKLKDLLGMKFEKPLSIDMQLFLRLCPSVLLEVVLSLRQAEIMQSCDYQLTNVFVSKPFCLKLLEPNI